MTAADEAAKYAEYLESRNERMDKQSWIIATAVLAIALVVVSIVLIVTLNQPEPKDCSMWETGSFDYFYCLELD